MILRTYNGGSKVLLKTLLLDDILYVYSGYLIGSINYDDNGFNNDNKTIIVGLK